MESLIASAVRSGGTSRSGMLWLFRYSVRLSGSTSSKSGRREQPAAASAPSSRKMRVGWLTSYHLGFSHGRLQLAVVTIREPRQRQPDARLDEAEPVQGPLGGNGIGFQEQGAVQILEALVERERAFGVAGQRAVAHLLH